MDRLTLDVGTGFETTRNALSSRPLPAALGGSWLLESPAKEEDL